MNPFWVDTGNQLRLAIVPRPRGGDWLEDEVAHIKRAGVDVLVSMLQANEAAELGLSTEASVCEAAGIVFRSFPIPDRETPPIVSEAITGISSRFSRRTSSARSGMTSHIVEKSLELSCYRLSSIHFPLFNTDLPF
jgi:hypothetical protein